MGRHGEFVGYWLQDGTFVNASEGKYRSTPLGGVESRGGVRPIIVVNFGK